MRRAFGILIIAVGVVAAACGGGDSGNTTGSGASASATRTVRIEMRDIAFTPKTVEVKKGETVEFVFTNAGKLPHDAFIGDAEAQTGHEEDMRAAEEHGGGHGGDTDAITVEPGKSGELTHTFDAAGTTLIGCHQPGHYEAGMQVAVTVS